jgi:hypothetical protein
MVGLTFVRMTALEPRNISHSFVQGTEFLFRYGFQYLVRLLRLYRLSICWPLWSRLR